MKRDPVLYLEDILVSIGKIEEYTKKSGKKAFFDSSEKQDAVIRRLEIIGEAVKNLSTEYKAENQDIPWKKIAGLRDILTHAYFGVNMDRVWNIIADDLPSLKKEIKAAIKEERRDQKLIYSDKELIEGVKKSSKEFHEGKGKTFKNAKEMKKYLGSL